MATYYAALGSQYQLQLDVTQASQDIPNNTSLVSWSLRINKLSGSGRYTFSSDSSSVTINGTTYYASFTYDFRSYSSLLIQSGSTTVAHNADGTKTISVSGTFDDVQANLGAGTASGTLGLTTIPRASVPTLSASTTDAGVAVTINTNRMSTAFTHTIEYDFGTLTAQTSGLAASTGVTTSTTLTPPLSILNEIPNALSGTLVVRVTTFNGATQIGSPQTVNLTVTVPTSVVPTVGSLTVTEGTVSPDVATLIGTYVQSISKVAATTKTVPGGASTVAGAYGSTIVSTKITVDGLTITGESGTTVSPLISAGTVPVVAETTDSRGRKGTRTVNINVLAYSLPTAPTVEVRRSLTGGTVDQSNGTFLRVDMAAAVASLINGSQKNLLQYRVSTSPAGANTWTVRQAATSTGASTLAFDSYTSPFPYVQITAGAPYSVTASYDVKVEILDKLSVSTYVRTVSQGKTLIDHNGNIGVSFGAYHSGGAFPVEIWGQGQQNGYDIVDKSLNATTARQGLVELATSAEATSGTDTDRAVTPAALTAAVRATAVPYTGTVSSTWTYGKPDVTLDDGSGTIVSAFLPANNSEIQPGSSVLLDRLPGGIWYIVAPVASAPQYLRQIPLTLNTAGGWVPYGAAEGDVSFTSNPNDVMLSDRYGPATATKSATGWVTVAGLVYKSTATSGTPMKIATLPAGMAPAYPMYFLALNASDTVAYAIEVRTNGEIWSTFTGLNAGYITLANIVFNVSLTYTALPLAGTWVANSASERVPSIAKDAYGLVSVAGAVKGGSNINGGVIVSGIPSGFRPVYDSYAATVTNGATGALVAFSTTPWAMGQYVPIGNTRKDFDGMFWNDSTAPAYQTIAYRGVWTSYAANYPPLSYYKRPDGLVHLRGFVKGGSIGLGNQIGMLPEGCRPVHRLILATVSNDASAALEIGGSGDIAARSGSNVWFAVNALFAAAR